MKLIKKITIVIILCSIIANCAWLPQNDTGCRNRYERHYDDKGHFIGTTWWTECEED